jgi:hypothetical protein
MKLLILTAIESFEKEIKMILKKANVKIYSFKKVTGFKDISEVAIENNWFATEINETKSILFYAFVRKENVDLCFDLVTDFNTKQKSLSHIHIAILNIEKSN